MKIMYFVAGEGMGHSIRSKSIIQELEKEHEVRIFCGKNKIKYFSNSKVNVITSFNITYINNEVKNIRTFFQNLIKLPKMYSCYKKVEEIYDKFKPNIIITDFEPIGSYLGMNKKCKVISIDNQHIIPKSKLNTKFNYIYQKILSKIAIFLTIPYSSKNIITHFFHPPIKDINTVIVNPVIRKQISELKCKNNGFYLVYQTSTSNQKLLDELQKIEEKFIIYGFHETKQIKNLNFKKNNEIEFYEDLANCKGIITNGGFTLISEALFLKKQIMSIPVKKQFEQVFNAIYLEKMQYGFFCERFNVSKFNEFKNKKFKKINFENGLQEVIKNIFKSA